MSEIRGVLQIGGFRTYRSLNEISHDDQRNTLITELDARTKDSAGFYQSLNDYELAGAGAILVFVRQAEIRNDAALLGMSADDIRNTLITEIDANQVGIGHGPPDFQAMSNLNLVYAGLTMNYWVLH